VIDVTLHNFLYLHHSGMTQLNLANGN